MPIYDVGETIAIKKMADDRALTAEESIEWLKCASDKDYWMRNYVYVQSESGRTLFTPRPYQTRIIKLAEDYRFNIIMSGRQTGKTATLAVDLMHDVIFNSDYRIGFTSYTDTNTQDVRERVGYIYESLPTWMKPPVKLYNQKIIRFSNKSSIQFQVTSMKTFRGKSLNRIIVDELAHVEEKIAEAFMTALLPSITGGGTVAKTRLTIISTPAGTSGTFAHYWYGAISKSNGFGNTLVEYDEIPNRGVEFERDMLTKMSKNKFDQEYRCIMISDKGTLVNSRTIEAIRDREPDLILGDLSLYTTQFANRKIMIACDVSDGIGQDSHAMQIFDVDTLEQIGEYSNNMMSQTFYTKEIIKAITYMFQQGAEEIYYTVENNGTGSGVIRLLENSNNSYLQKATFVSDIDGKKSGMVMSKSSKERACSLFKDLVEMHKLKINSTKLKTQMKFFVKVGATFKAESGTHDDLVMACVLMMLLMDVLSNYEESMYDVVSELDESPDDDDWGIVW
ncbi:DNA terminase packaging enzyme large subunit [Alishewanella phage vB_AspM_Slickus01]|nr:DNA terminase packaging enzyme large subunit [Alishewanella phage vB_AspM_Slickus01]